MKMQIARPIILNHIVSPYGIATISTLIFLLAWVFPSQLYSSLVNEPDLMFFDAPTLLFFLLCVVGFWFGLLVVDFLFPSKGLLYTEFQPSPLQGFRLLFPLLVTTAVSVVSGVELYRQTPNLFVMLVAQQGLAVKSGLNELSLGPLGWGPVFQSPVLWWTYWRLSNPGGRPGRRIFPWTIFYFGLAVQVAIAVVRVSRSDLMPIFGGFAVLYFMIRIRRGELSTGRILSRLLLFALIVLSVFIGISLLRGTSDPSVAFGDFAGYTIASYNRLTALLHGTMHYPYGGRGYYIFVCLAENNLLRSLLPLKDILAWPDHAGSWYSEFQGPQLAGLNSYLIWAGAFGYLFSDLGWATPLILVVYGVIYGFAWREAKSGTALGLTLYPWLAFSAFSWFSSNLAFDTRFPFYLVAGVFLTAYERLLGTRESKTIIRRVSTA